MSNDTPFRPVPRKTHEIWWEQALQMSQLHDDPTVSNKTIKVVVLIARQIVPTVHRLSFVVVKLFFAFVGFALRELKSF